MIWADGRNLLASTTPMCHLRLGSLQWDSCSERHFCQRSPNEQKAHEVMTHGKMFVKSIAVHAVNITVPPGVGSHILSWGKISWMAEPSPSSRSVRLLPSSRLGSPKKLCGSPAEAKQRLCGADGHAGKVQDGGAWAAQQFHP